MKKIFTKLFYLSLLIGFINPIDVSAQCPTLDDVVFPPVINTSDDQLDYSTYTDELSPENLVLNYGFLETDAYPTWEDPDECENLLHTFDDIILNVNGSSFKIIRDWTVLDWLDGNVIEEYQIIKNIVDIGSQAYCLNQLTISVSPWSCNAFIVSPENFLLDGFNYENVTMTPDITTEFGLGIHNIVVNATLGTETIECNSTLIVVDNTPPVVVASENIVLQLSEDCTANLFPAAVDNGSHDGNCGGVTLSVSPSSFTAADAGTTVTVYLTAVDEAGNSNYTWSTVTIEECGDPSFSCLSLITISGLDEGDVELYPEDFLSANSTNSGDLSLTLEDSSGNLITNGFLPQGTEGNFLYTVIDNTTGETCTGVVQVPVFNSPCDILACRSTVHKNLEENGTISLEASDFSFNVEGCLDLTVEIFDEDSNLLYSGSSVTLNEAGVYQYQVNNTEGNACWGTLRIYEYIPCPTTLACNTSINFSMYYSTENSSYVAEVIPDYLLEGSSSGCNTEDFLIELTDTGLGGNNYSGIGFVLVDEPGTYNYSITNSENGTSCWGTVVMEIKTTCPELDDVSFPEDLDLTIVGINALNVTQITSPESLEFIYGYSAEQVKPTWPSVPGCTNIAVSYEDFTWGAAGPITPIFRTWTAINWLTGNTWVQDQVLNNNINQGLICDFLPNSAPLGDCESGHTDTDDIEWPDDIAIADYRIKPSELVLYSQIEIEDSEPIIVNNQDIYSINYVDLLNQLEVNSITVNRVWTVSTNNLNVATYTQVLEVDITGFASLVAVNTMFQRPVPGVELAPSEFTNEFGVGFPSETDNLNPSKSDVSNNGVTIKDYIMIQQHILGLSNLNDLQLLAADVNDSDIVSAADLVSINKSILDISPFTNPDWFFIDAPESDNTINPSQEYIAIKPGDVDDDANLGSGVLLETGTMLLEDVLINNGENYQTRLQYAGEELSLGAEVHLYYNPSLITINNLNVENPDMRLDFNLDIPGEIHLTLSKTNSLGFLFAGENLINIDFTASSNGLLSQAIEGTAPRNSFLLGLDYELVILDVEMVDQIDTGTKDVSTHSEIFDVYPNPASDNLTFDFLDGSTNNFKINIYNISGQQVAEYNNQNNIDVSSLHSGMHFYRLIKDGQTYSGRISIVK